jgi:Raf kinase inhibitor-like YbhB/YbcL family protein
MEDGTMRKLAVGTSLILVLASCGRRPSTEAILPKEQEKLTLRLSSPAFAEGGAIPKAYTCDGKDTSPPLEWSSVPEAARSLALVVEDPDAPGGTWIHWVLFDLPADVTRLPEGVPTEERVALGSDGQSARQGKNDFGKIGYGGPCPPSGTHHYIFRVFALDTELGLERGTNREPLLRAIRGHILAEGRLTGVYSRR